MTMTEKLDILMSEKGINKSQLSRLSGIPYMTIVNFYEKGTENIKRSTLIKLSRFFEVTVDYMIIDEETRRAYPSVAPKSGQITALPTSIIKPRVYRSVKGFPLLDEQNVACYDEVPQSIRCDFTMRFSGDSMKKLNINDGDIVYASMMEDVRSHEVAVVLLDGGLTLRRVYKNEKPDRFDGGKSRLLRPSSCARAQTSASSARPSPFSIQTLLQILFLHNVL